MWNTDESRSESLELQKLREIKHNFIVQDMRTYIKKNKWNLEGVVLFFLDIKAELPEEPKKGGLLELDKL